MYIFVGKEHLRERFWNAWGQALERQQAMPQQPPRFGSFVDTVSALLWPINEEDKTNQRMDTYMDGHRPWAKKYFNKLYFGV